MSTPSDDIVQLKQRLEEAEATLAAIREGHIDALVVSASEGDQVFTLRTADHPYRILVETMNEGAATVLSDGTVLYSNRRFADMLRSTSEKVAGGSIFDFVAAEHRHTVQDLLDTGLQGRGSRETELLNAEGGRLPVLLSVNRVDIDQTRAICIIATDLTSQKRNEEIVRSERLARLILEQAGEAIIVCDAQGRIVRANEAARALRGERLAGEQFDSALPLVGVGDGAAFSLAPVFQGERVQGLQLCLNLHGRAPAYLLVSAGPLVNDDGAVIGCVVTLTDFTETRNVTAALMRTNSELEQFAFAAAHDLQEPLRMVSTYSQLLVRRYGDKVDREGRQFTAYIENGVKRMQALLRDLLSYSRISYDGDQRPESVDCNEVVRGVLKNLELTIRESSAEISVEDLPAVYAGPGELLEVFQNLIANSLKYCAAKPPRIRVFAVRGEREHTLAVADNGIGIPRQYHDRIFGLFKRLHGGEYPGTGIGLAICKRVVEKYGGRIWVESEPGQGSTFYFRLPAQARSAR